MTSFHDAADGKLTSLLGSKLLRYEPPAGSTKAAEGSSFHMPRHATKKAFNRGPRKCFGTQRHMSPKNLFHFPRGHPAALWVHDLVCECPLTMASPSQDGDRTPNAEVPPSQPQDLDENAQASQPGSSGSPTQGVTSTQLASVYEELDKEGETEWQAMKQRVADSCDPCEGSKERLQKLIAKLLPEVSAEPAAQVQFLEVCSKERRDKFFQDWSAHVFDLGSVEQDLKWVWGHFMPISNFVLHT